MSDSTSVRWARVKELVGEAISLPAGERRAWLDNAITADAALLAEVEALVQAHEDAGEFLETPAIRSPGAAEAVADAARGGAHDRPLPARYGAYRIVRELGRGGMGVVYLGARDDDQFEKLAAIKVVSGDFVHPVIAQRFQAERRILASLDHPNIARLLDAGTTDLGVPYVVMEYVEGEPIDTYCTSRRLGARQRLALFQQVCGAVQYSHQHLVVHRDIKSRNILVTVGGVPKLLDFGIAKLLEQDGTDAHATRTAFRVLTPESASPEQVRGEPVTVLTDVYSLGVLLYRLLTDRSPYRGEMRSEIDMVRAICQEEPVRPSDAVLGRTGDAGAISARDLRGDLDLIILKALHKDLTRRYGSVEQLNDDLARHLDGHPVIAQADSIRYRASKFVARHRVGVAASALVAISLVGGVIATVWQARIAGVERARAERRFNDVRRLSTSFLFEFHDAIEPLPGSTKARELVVRRAREYLDSLYAESGNDASLQRDLAAAYERVGDVQGLPQWANLGDTSGALESHKRALALLNSLAAAAPDDRAIQGDLAATNNHMSSLLDETRDYRGALEYAQRAFALREALAAANPSGIPERRMLAAGYHEIGSLKVSLGDLPAALENYQKETAVFDAVLAGDPSNEGFQRDAAIAYRVLGAVTERNGDRATATTWYGKSIALDERRVAANPNNTQAKLDLSFGYASIGYTLSRLNRIDESLENYGRALTLREQASAADPHDVNAKDTVTRAHLSIGQVLRVANRRDDALTHLRAALVLGEERFAADRANAGAGERVANIYGALAGTQAEAAAATTSAADAARRWREARAWSQKSLDMWAVRQAIGPLSPTAVTEVAGLKELVAKCDAAVAKK